jgi:hypothetical protein
MYMTKKILVTTFIMAMLSTIYAQRVAHATIFCEDHHKFTIFLNGEKKNDVPQENVRIINLNQLYFKLRIDFENAEIPPIEKKLFQVQDAQGNPVDATFKITANKKGEYGIHWVSQMSNPAYIETNKPTVIVIGGGTTVEQTTTQTVHEANGVSMNFGVPGGSIKINTGKNNAPQTTTTTTIVNKGVTSTALPCTNVLGEADFSEALKSIADRSTYEGKLLSAKQIISSNCFTVAMVKRVMQLFQNEDSKLAVAIHAYDLTIDKGSYYKLNSEFKEEKNIDALNSAVVK